MQIEFLFTAEADPKKGCRNITDYETGVWKSTRVGIRKNKIPLRF
jgi:hypothetical protein